MCVCFKDLISVFRKYESCLIILLVIGLGFDIIFDLCWNENLQVVYLLLFFHDLFL